MLDFIHEALSKQDLELIEHYRDETLNEDNESYNYSNIAPIEKILTHWATAKSHYLYDLFKRKLILEKEITANKPIEKLAADLSKKDGLYLVSFERQLTHEMETYNPSNSIIRTNRFASQLFSYEAIVKNIYEGPTVILKNKDNEYFKLQQGMKIIKAYGCLVDFYNLADTEVTRFVTKSSYGITFAEVFQNIRNAQSVVRNQAKLHGTLCLSIHPLDYMTMSDNSNNWSTCMHWRNGGGDYRLGTVEMMNSDMVIVAYLKSAKPYQFSPNPDDIWNNKQWRQLFIVRPDFTIGIKGYPYRNDELTKMCLDWIAQLMDKPFMPDYYTYFEDNDQIMEIPNSKLSFYTESMYNDFGTLPFHLMKIAKDFDSNASIDVYYSGPNVCMICGQERFDAYGDSEALCCEECSGPHIYCTCCGERIYSNEGMYSFDDYDTDQIYCEDCFSERSFYCPRCGGSYHLLNSIRLIVATSSYLYDNAEDLFSHNPHDLTFYNDEICESCANALKRDPLNYFHNYNDEDYEMQIYNFGETILIVTNDTEFRRHNYNHNLTLANYDADIFSELDWENTRVY